MSTPPTPARAQHDHSTRRRVLLVGGAMDTWWGLAQKLREAGMDLTPVPREVEETSIGLQAARESAVVVADLSTEPERALRAIEACRAVAPGVPVITVATDLSLELARRLRLSSVFYVALHPVDPDEILSALENAFQRLGSTAVSSSCQARRVLVIDDDEDFCASATALLEREGYAVSSARSGKEGLARIISESPDLVILDIMMESQWTGYEVTQAMKFGEDLPSLHGIPILMVSSIDTPPTERFRFAPEMPMVCPDCYMTKPLDIPLFLSRVRELLKSARP